ncbi:ufm1-specific protease 2 isoform X2 [Hydra vulgaris]|uniref:Ufm1-specific protease 2 isoform X2 n=1 Tax=Hydra vulgaris TaxID=6087 RepID=A0ABM4D568_HYDVU
MADDNGDHESSISLTPHAESKINRSRHAKEKFSCGYLFGINIEKKIRVYDLVELDLGLFENNDATNILTDEIQVEFACIRSSFPVGLDIIGVFITQPEQENIEVAEHLLKILKQLEDIELALAFVLCLIKPSECLWQVLSKIDGNIPVRNVYSEADVELKQPLFRIFYDVLVKWLINTGIEGLLKEIDKLFEELILNKISFLLESTGTILYDNDAFQNSPYLTCADLVSDIKSNLGLKLSDNSFLDKVISLQCLMRITSDEQENEQLEEDKETAQCNVPVLLSNSLVGECIVFKLSVDALATVTLNTTFEKLLFMLRDSIFRQQHALRLLMKLGGLSYLYSSVHVQLPGADFPMTVLLPSVDLKGIEVPEENYSSYKEKLHDRFLLTKEYPVFRRVLSYFDNRTNKIFQIVNPHESLKHPVVEGSMMALVNGKYAYHHYMQDNFDDNGWGCAYRSLQTLSSWFWLQGYSDRLYPHHKEIQEALFAMGDKDIKFVGSKDWIGSVEVGYCLDYFYHVTCKTLYVSSGADLAFKGRELYTHFKEQGTPLMIGGGVLAHTIVGVIFNEHTGETKFLVVDPHYTGTDNLKIILSKGWVGWKGPDFWDKNSHYNLCMPQRPKVI